MEAFAFVDSFKARWQQLSAGWRLVVGTCLVIVIAFIGLTPKTLFGMTLAWPYAAFWAAVGWGMSGISLRPLVLLTLFGLFQDVADAGPLGCFMVVFIAVYGLSAFAGENLDFNADPFRRLFIAPVAIAFGFFVLWVISSSYQEYRVSIGGFIGPFLATILGYAVFSWVFRLRPDPLRVR